MFDLRGDERAAAQRLQPEPVRTVCDLWLSKMDPYTSRPKTRAVVPKEGPQLKSDPSSSGIDLIAVRFNVVFSMASLVEGGAHELRMTWKARLCTRAELRLLL